MEKEIKKIKNNNQFTIEVSGAKQNFVKGGDFFIYGDIDETIPHTIISPLIREIKKRIELAEPTPIDFYITSYGGYLSYAFDLITWFEHAKNCGIEIHTYVTSVAFSAASLIAVSGHKRYASSRAYHGIHFARGWDYSHNPVMSDRNVENFKWMQAELVKVYKERTKLTDIEAKLLADNYMINGGAELLKSGFVDEVIENPFQIKETKRKTTKK